MISVRQQHRLHPREFLWGREFSQRGIVERLEMQQSREASYRQCGKNIVSQISTKANIFSVRVRVKDLIYLFEVKKSRKNSQIFQTFRFSERVGMYVLDVIVLEISVTRIFVNNE